MCILEWCAIQFESTTGHEHHILNQVDMSLDLTKATTLQHFRKLTGLKLS